MECGSSHSHLPSGDAESSVERISGEKEGEREDKDMDQRGERERSGEKKLFGMSIN